MHSLISHVSQFNHTNKCTRLNYHKHPQVRVACTSKHSHFQSIVNKWNKKNDTKRRERIDTFRSKLNECDDLARNDLDNTITFHKDLLLAAKELFESRLDDKWNKKEDSEAPSAISEKVDRTDPFDL